MDLLGQMIPLCLKFWGAAKPFSKGPGPLYILTSNYRGSIFSISLLMLLLLSRFSRVWLCDPIDGSQPGSAWDSPGKNIGVGCHFLFQCMKVKSESEVAQSSLTLSDPMDCSLPGSSIHGIFQARVLEWVAIAFSRSLLILVFLIITILLGVQWLSHCGFDLHCPDG